MVSKNTRLRCYSAAVGVSAGLLIAGGALSNHAENVSKDAQRAESSAEQGFGQWGADRMDELGQTLQHVGAQVGIIVSGLTLHEGYVDRRRHVLPYVSYEKSF